MEVQNFRKITDFLKRNLQNIPQFNTGKTERFQCGSGRTWKTLGYRPISLQDTAKNHKRLAKQLIQASLEIVAHGCALTAGEVNPHHIFLHTSIIDGPYTSRHTTVSDLYNSFL